MFLIRRLCLCLCAIVFKGNPFAQAPITRIKAFW
jgi:hypothetical protein